MKDRDIKALCWRLAHCEQLFPRPAIIWLWGKEKPGGSRLIRQRLWLSASTCNRKTSAALVLKENMWPPPGLIALRLPCDSLDRGLRGGGLCLCAALMWNISWHSEPSSTHTHRNAAGLTTLHFRWGCLWQAFSLLVQSCMTCLLVYWPPVWTSVEETRIEEKRQDWEETRREETETRRDWDKNCRGEMGTEQQSRTEHTKSNILFTLISR